MVAGPTSTEDSVLEVPLEDGLLREPVEITNVDDVVTVVRDATTDLLTAVIAQLPVLVLAVLVLVVGLLVTRYALRGVERGLRRGRVDHTVERLIVLVLRVALVVAWILFALSLAGISVGAALAGIGLVGLALAFALQSILENFIAGVLILIRKPFRHGDQIVTGEFEGTVEDIDLRVTRLRSYDGVALLVPNATVFTQPLINHTRNGARRTRVLVGIDYRDDHDAAGPLLEAAVAAVDGVLPEPPPQALVIELGDSSVDFEVRYWTQPQQMTVRVVQDRVLRACKTAIEGAGMSIPWPIRTLAPDKDALTVSRRDADTAPH